MTMALSTCHSVNMCATFWIQWQCDGWKVLSNFFKESHGISLIIWIRWTWTFSHLKFHCKKYNYKLLSILGMQQPAQDIHFLSFNHPHSIRFRVWSLIGVTGFGFQVHLWNWITFVFVVDLLIMNSKKVGKFTCHFVRNLHMLLLLVV